MRASCPLLLRVSVLCACLLIGACSDDAADILNYGTAYSRTSQVVALDAMNPTRIFRIDVFPSVDGETATNCPSNQPMERLLMLSELAQMPEMPAPAASSVRVELRSDPAFAGTDEQAEALLSIGQETSHGRVRIYAGDRNTCRAFLTFTLESGTDVSGEFTLISGYFGSGRVGPEATIPGYVVEDVTP